MIPTSNHSTKPGQVHPPEHVGARLINVAISRAKHRLIVLANLTYLDRKLPSMSLLRSVLYDMQTNGTVVTGNEVLALRPIARDLKGLIGRIPLDPVTGTYGLFDEAAFERTLVHDIREAASSVVIFSGYVTPARVGKLGDLLRSKIADGVKIRCVTRPPQTNGSIPPDQGRQALDILEGIGVIVDCRAKIHQKVCLIDNRIVWLGSLNALSHAGRADESMTRVVNGGYAAAVAAHMSKRRVSTDKAAAMVADAENPRCQRCGCRQSTSRAVMARSTLAKATAAGEPIRALSMWTLLDSEPPPPKRARNQRGDRIAPYAASTRTFARAATGPSTAAPIIQPAMGRCAAIHSAKDRRCPRDDTSIHARHRRQKSYGVNRTWSFR